MECDGRFEKRERGKVAANYDRELVNMAEEVVD